MLINIAAATTPNLRTWSTQLMQEAAEVAPYDYEAMSQGLRLKGEGKKWDKGRISHEVAANSWSSGGRTWLCQKNVATTAILTGHGQENELLNCS